MASPITASVCFPSDAAVRERSLAPLRVGGRVQALAKDIVWLADAFAQLPCQIPASLPSPSVGDWLLLAGSFVGERFVATSVELHQPCPEPRGTGEFSRFGWQGLASCLERRAALEAKVRQWFSTEGFLEVKTPTLLSAPGMDSGVDALQAEGGYLVTSPELAMKRLLVGGLPRLFQLAPCFRRDERGPLHRAEFTMLEWYRAFADLACVLDDTEALITHLARELGRESVLVRGRRIDLTGPFLRLSVDEAFQRFADEREVYRLAAESPDRYFELLVSAVEPGLATLDRPVFLTRYPASQAALARVCPEDPRAAERAELYVGGVELSNGYGELTDPLEQRQRFEAELLERRRQGKPEYPLDENFLAALEEGMPPSAGNALGFDRLVMLLLEQPTIDRTLAF